MKCACTFDARAPATFLESAELSCACPIFRHEKFAEPTRYVMALVGVKSLCVSPSFGNIDIGIHDTMAAVSTLPAVSNAVPLTRGAYTSDCMVAVPTNNDCKSNGSSSLYLLYCSGFKEISTACWWC